MKLSFSTNGWKLPFTDFIKLANVNGLGAVELHSPNASFGNVNPFSKANINDTVRLLRENGLCVCALDTSVNLADQDYDDKSIQTLAEDIATAENARTQLVRVHAYLTGDMTLTRADALVRERLPFLIAAAKKHDVILLVESMGVYSDSSVLKTLLEDFADDNLAALWDVHHTVRFGNEMPEVTIKNLGAYVYHVHIKDSYVDKNGVIRYGLMGEGTLPIKDAVEALRSINYDGYLSLELQSGWVEEIGSADIVFPQFAAFMSKFDVVPDWKKNLYYNKAGTGRYVWKKEELISNTFPQVLDRMCEEFPDQIAFKYTTLDYTRTYSEFRDDVNDFARALVALGVKKGDKVAAWATNVPEWYIAFWASAKIGAILVTVNTAYKIHEAEYLLRQSDTRILVMTKGWRDSDYKGIINELCPELALCKKGEALHAKRLPFLRGVITVGFSMKGALTFAEALEYKDKVTVEEINRRAALVKPDDCCNMQYTSGTTGFPKGVMLTHYNVVNNGKCIGDRMDLSTADRMMIQVPMFHCFGMVLAMTASMTHGVSIRPLPYFSPKPALACINSEKITCFHGVPTMFIAMLAHEDFAKTDFSYMRTGIMAGSPCPVKVMEEVLDKMNMKEITIVYGQTEASPGCTMSSTDDSIEVRVNTVGRALPSVECKIVDPETNEELPFDTVGEFVARGYNVMKGYYKMPAETAKAIDADGWLHTGDLALKRPDGNYRITGRLKDMIIRGGENLYPKEIEDFIYTIPCVKDVQVIGVPDEKYGEEAYAYIILNDGESVTEDELRKYMTERIAKHKVPRYIEITDGFPTNAAGKILKYKMRENAVERLKSLKK